MMYMVLMMFLIQFESVWNDEGGDLRVVISM